MISQEMLEKYKTLYRKNFGKDISDQEALEQATKLITLVSLIYKPITQEELERVERRRLETQ